jgi:KDO2-lipid IV(A) lauroyltransferase
LHAPFFNLPANTMTLLPRLAAKTGAAVIFCYAERLSKNRGFHLHFLPGSAQIGHADPLTGATALNAGIETCVRRLPEQYQWSYKRFKIRPPGTPRYY